uniref:Uncharacterized protein n=1 Tax=Alexandrium monilatum TaxID=311494 RepID=A0A7S4PW57_9DINO
MEYDFEAGLHARSQAFGGSSGAGVAWDEGSDRERMLRMRRRIRQHQERYARSLERQKKDEERMAATWKERVDKHREASSEERQARLARLDRERVRAAQRAEWRQQAAQRAAAEAEAEAAAPAASRAAEAAVPRPRGEVGARSSGPAETLPEAEPDTARSPRRPAEQKVTGGGPETKLQRELGVHALVKAMLSGQQPKQAPSLKAPQAKLSTDAGAAGAVAEEEHHSSAREMTPAKHRSVARKHRLRTMHAVAGQVLQCRQEMNGAFQNAFAVPSIDSHFV